MRLSKRNLAVAALLAAMLAPAIALAATTAAADRDPETKPDAEVPRWQAGVYYTYDHFTPDDVDWHEGQLYLKRRTPIGSVIGRFSHAWRYGTTDDLIEVEAYPKIRPGTYAWVSLGYSPGADLYPRYRFGGDLYQSLPASFEASLGYRRLGFTSPVNIYVGSLGKYVGSWLVTGRVFVTPGGAGTSNSWSIGARRYFGTAAYWGFRYGQGRSPEEIRTTSQLEVLNSRSVGGELVLPLARRWEIDVRASYGREDRIERADLDHASVGVGLFRAF
jgi:YaiO family outer membrane protein